MKPPSIAAAATVLLGASLAWAGKNVPLDQLPAAVRATIERETAGGQIKEIEQDHEGGQLIYEVEFTQGGQEFELDVAADGKLLERRLD
jgi:hypothetical protein